MPVLRAVAYHHCKLGVQSHMVTTACMSWDLSDIFDCCFSYLESWISEGEAQKPLKLLCSGGNRWEGSILSEDETDAKDAECSVNSMREQPVWGQICSEAAAGPCCEMGSLWREKDLWKIQSVFVLFAFRENSRVPRNCCFFPECIHLFRVSFSSFVHFLPNWFLMIKTKACCSLGFISALFLCS